LPVRVGQLDALMKITNEKAQGFLWVTSLIDLDFL